MNTWLRLMDNYYAGFDVTGVTCIKNMLNGMQNTVIRVYDDDLSQTGYVRKAVSKFHIEDYNKNGSDLNGNSYANENVGCFDIVMENLYVKDSPFRVFYHKDDIIYTPNILYKGCQVSLRKGARYTGIFYDSCVVKYD